MKYACAILSSVASPVVLYFSTLSHNQYYAGDKIEKNEMGCACGAYG